MNSRAPLLNNGGEFLGTRGEWYVAVVVGCAHVVKRLHEGDVVHLGIQLVAETFISRAGTQHDLALNRFAQILGNGREHLFQFTWGQVREHPHYVLGLAVGLCGVGCWCRQGAK